MSYLAVRSGIYFLRLHVPRPLQAVLGQKEIFQNLHTSNKAEAKVLALSLTAQLLLSFARVKGEMKKRKTPEEEAQLARWITSSITADREALPAFTEEERLALTKSSEPRKTLFELAILNNGMPYIKQAQPGTDLEAAKEALAMAQEASKQQSSTQAATRDLKSLTREMKEALSGVKPKNIHGAAKAYEEWLKTDRQVASWDHYMAGVNHFVSWITGLHPNIAVHKISRDHIKDYKQVLQAVRSHKKPHNLLHPNNVFKRMGFIEAFFRYCQQEDWIEDGPKKLPTSGLKGDKPDYEDSEDSYVPFTGEDLKQIFSAKNYQQISKLPHRFWPPLICLFTGLRRTELASLKLEQISNFNPDKVWTIKITGKVKNKNSRRTVPLHQTLIDLGLLDYIQDLKKHFPNAVDLFPYSTNASKAVGDGFAEYLDEIKIVHPKKVFHSFRKNVSQRLLQAGVVDIKYQEHYTGHLKYSLHESIYSGKEKPLAFYSNLINNNLTYDIDLSVLKYNSGMFEELLMRKKTIGKPSNNRSKHAKK